jgi:hypothetical protein
MGFFKNADEPDEYIACHILCSTSPKFPCMRGDLPAECSVPRTTTQNRKTGRHHG